jgi:hypothetical protein
MNIKSQQKTDQRQHITIELIAGLPDYKIDKLIPPLVKTIIKEQLIKRDIGNGKIRFI